MNKLWIGIPLATVAVASAADRLPRFAFALTVSQDARICVLSLPDGSEEPSKKGFTDKIARHGFCAEVKAGEPSTIYYNPNPPLAVE